ncbi:hypothetical protein B4102_3771 [Heyndrickxia sporothermodurans]|uniref:Uncharacterized protein n=1 Tax=Heyndrickxia sporothermodurans TaxID=46224 RepID=A0A150KN92_9BACI|nr:hypothetical protein [Heyndrickxia sporothermodurans]KYC92230.1 hypothetical protein B4102_3771 [Heyndrickxia sporothermodurans]
MRYLKDLAERKYNYYCRIYKKSPHAYTTEQCYERIILKSKYEELTDVIDYLPLEHQVLIDKYYDVLLEAERPDNGGINAPTMSTEQVEGRGEKC